MSRLPSASSGFFQARDEPIQVISTQVPGNWTIGAAARGASSTGRQVLNLLNTTLGAADSTVKSIGKFKAADEGRGAEQALTDYQPLAAAIENDAPEWDISVYDVGEDGAMTLKDSQTVRNEIMARLPIPADAREDYREGYLNRIMPSLERAIYSRGLEQRTNFITGQMSLISDGLVSRLNTYHDAKAENPELTQEEHYRGFRPRPTVMSPICSTNGRGDR